MAEMFAKFEAIWQAIWDYLYKVFAYWTPEDAE